MDTKALDRNERALDRLYRSLQANHGRSGGRQIHECSARTTLECATEDLISWMAEERGFSVNYQINIRQGLEPAISLDNGRRLNAMVGEHSDTTVGGRA